MPDIDEWAGNSFPLSTWAADWDPAVDAAQIIADRSTSITIVRNGTAQDAQTVRIEDFRNRNSPSTDAGMTGITDVLIIGYKGHPTIDDTDIQRGDRFVISGEMYEVEIVVPGLNNQLQAYAKVRS